MPQEWDDTIKRLIRSYPQHYVWWVLREAIYKDALSGELKNWTRETDFLLEVTLHGEEMLLHLEFQSREDINMAQRLLEYNVMATREHKRKVYSCVIYLREDSIIAESPLVWELTNGQETLRFHFGVIKLWEIPTETIREAGLVGLLPLLPLTRSGKRYEVVEEMIEGIVAAKDYQLLEYGHMFAGLVFKKEADREWLKRRFAVYRDILEDSWVYQETKQEGKLEAWHQAVLDVIQERFPEIMPFAKRQVDGIEDTEVLRRLNLKMSTVQTIEEALEYLLTLSKSEKKN